MLCGSKASLQGFNINVHSGKAPSSKISGGISTSSIYWTTLGIISSPTILFQRSVDCNRVESCVFTGTPTEAQMNQNSASTTAIEVQSILKVHRIHKGSQISLVLVMRLRNYKLLYFGSFTEFDVMSEERPELSRKWRNSEKTF